MKVTLGTNHRSRLRINAVFAARRVIRDRFRAVLLASKGRRVLDIADTIDRSPRFVQHWVARYRSGGVDALWKRQRVGRPTKLREDSVEKFVERYQAGPDRKWGRRRWRATQLQRVLKDDFGADYSVQGVYDLLERLGLPSIQFHPGLKRRYRPRPKVDDLGPRWKKGVQATPWEYREVIRAARARRHREQRQAELTKQIEKYQDEVTIPALLRHIEAELAERRLSYLDSMCKSFEPFGIE